MGEPDASGRKRPIPTDRLSVVSGEHVLLAVGQSSDLGIFPSEWTVREGRAYEAERPAHVWLAGDLTTGAGTVAHAVGHGRTVAERVMRWFDTQDAAGTELSSPVPNLVTSDKIRFTHFPVTEPRQDRHLPVASRTSGFQEVNLGLADVGEAERCLSCGRCTQCDTCMISCPEGIVIRGAEGYAIDRDYCKGCGICVWECPRNAMHMTVGT